MADNVIRRQKASAHPLPVEGCLKMFGVSKSGYYAWKHRREADAKEKEERKKELDKIMGAFREVCHKLGYIPGKRTFRTYMFRDYGMNVSVKRCAKVMRMMNLVANRPKKDAYKGQATHDHRCDSPENKVKQEFYIGPRKVVLTDITYFYYGKNRSPLYLCAFYDAFTKEVLGKAAGTKMDTGLVKKAYGRMKDKHGKQLKGQTDVYIHSDQGSQYLSATFKELLSDDGFIQSVSRRGNSQDNAPMESFFDRMKCKVIDLVALCPDAETAVRMIENYLDDYNDKHYQYSLAGLAPAEYYIYAATGIYPCESYYGVKASELMPAGDLVQARREAAAKKEEKVREARKAGNQEAEMLVTAPTLIVSRDQNRLYREKNKWRKSKELAEKQVAHIESIIEKTHTALHFLMTASKEILEELKYKDNWKKYKELDYIAEMKMMF